MLNWVLPSAGNWFNVSSSFNIPANRNECKHNHFTSIGHRWLSVSQEFTTADANSYMTDSCNVWYAEVDYLVLSLLMRSHSESEKDILTIWLHGTLNLHLKDAEKQTFTSENECNESSQQMQLPAGVAHNTTHKHQEQQQMRLILTHSRFCASWFLMLHSLIHVTK